MSVQELQQTFFKDVMSLFQDVVDRQTEMLSNDTGKVNIIPFHMSATHNSNYVLDFKLALSIKNSRFVQCLWLR